MTDYHSKGQYFTTNIELQNSVINFIKNKPDVILEPSIGQGDLVVSIQNKLNVPFHMYEIDTNIKLLDPIKRNLVNYGDFIQASIQRKYTTIVGNPPYVKKSTGNLYIEFIEKCFNLLDNNGELIFIIPSDFFKLTSAARLLNNMLSVGNFTHIFHPNKENLFKNASIDVIVFRYCLKIQNPQTTLYNNVMKYLINTNGTITFSDKLTNGYLIKDHFNVYVGMVTGKESVYKNDTFGNITLLNKQNVLDKYIFINEFPTSNQQLNQYMLDNKDILINRKIKKFTEDNWWLWGAPRNQKNIENNLGKDCIYIYNLTRQKVIAFVDKVQYFGGSMIMLIPKENIDLKKVCHYLNSDVFKSNYIYANRFKIGHRQLSNASIIF